MRLGVIVAGVVVGVAFVFAFLDMERRARELAECNTTRRALQTEVMRQWRRHFAEPPRVSEMVTVYPAGWACAQLSDGRWECRAP